MRISYRGHEITVTREKCLAGYPLLFYSVFRESDGFECVSGCEDSAETVRGLVSTMKQRVDNELKEDDPWLEQSGLL